MKNKPNMGISLRVLVNQLVNNTNRTAARTQSSIENDIAGEIAMMGDKEKIAPVISELLATVVTNARQGNIHISAERFKDTLTLLIQERNNYNGYALACRIRSLEEEALRLGGHISMKGEKQLVTTISFSFPNQSGASPYGGGNQAGHFTC